MAVSQAGLPPHAHAMMAMPGYHNFAYPSGMPAMFPGLSKSISNIFFDTKFNMNIKKVSLTLAQFIR